MLVYLLIFPFV